MKFDMKKTIVRKLIAAVLFAIAVFGLCPAAGARNVYVEKQAYTICSEGEKENQGYIGVIRDDSIPDPENTREQYLFYADDAGQAYIGYEFFEPFLANTLIFTSGAVSDEGGWFADGEIHVEGLAGGVWTELRAYPTPDYPASSEAGAFSPGAVYVFNFMPVFIDGIRLTGKPGGTEGFVSCSELDVLCDVNLGEYESLKDYIKATSSESGAWIESLGHPIATVAAPDVSGGSGRLTDINDGYIPKAGDNYKLQFDTVHSEWKKQTGHEEYLGYVFEEPVEIELIEFTEGGNFYDGGWFRDGSLRIEAYQDYQWTSVPFVSVPEYPDSNNQADFLPDYETYTFMLDEPTVCSGIRIIGKAGGSASFISCGELRVKKHVEEAEVKTEPLPVLEPLVAAENTEAEKKEDPSADKEDPPVNGFSPYLILIPVLTVLAAAFVILWLRRKKKT